MAGSSSEGNPAVLLTGASGFIGGALAQMLQEKGYALRVLTRDPRKLDRFPWTDRADIRGGDLCSPGDLAAACEGVDTVVHCAGFAHAAGGQDAQHRAVNFQGSVNLLDAAIAAGCRRFLFISSSKAASADPNAYALAKRKAEERVLAAHRDGRIQACCLRPAAVYGPGMKGSLAAWLRLTKRGLAPPVPPQAGQVAMIGLRDLCAAVLLALESEKVWGKTYLLSDGRTYPIKEIENGIRQAMGKKAAGLYVPRPAFALAAVLGDAIRYLPGIHIPFSRAGYNTLFSRERVEDDSFQRDTGFAPLQDFHQELPALLQELSEEQQH